MTRRRRSRDERWTADHEPLWAAFVEERDVLRENYRAAILEAKENYDRGRGEAVRRYHDSVDRLEDRYDEELRELAEKGGAA